MTIISVRYRIIHSLIHVAHDASARSGCARLSSHCSVQRHRQLCRMFRTDTIKSTSGLLRNDTLRMGSTTESADWDRKVSSRSDEYTVACGRLWLYTCAALLTEARRGVVRPAFNRGSDSSKTHDIDPLEQGNLNKPPQLTVACRDTGALTAFGLWIASLPAL